MLRLGDDRGAVAVLVAILMVPLLGFAAISIDIAATHAEKQQLQTGADAAALAIAQDCARKACGSPTLTAQKLATLNSNSGEAVAALPSVPTAATGRVTVNNSAVRNHWFAPVLGVDSTDITASSTAGWGSPLGGTAALPLIFSLCDFKRFAIDGRPTGIEQTIITTPAGDGCTGFDGPHRMPGGFGWLETDSKRSCSTTTRVGQKAYSEPGNSPKQCDLSTIRNRTVLVPVFDETNIEKVGGNGRGAWYEVYGYAAFTVTGYHFSGQSWNSPCGGNQRCIRGHFTTQLHEDPDFDYGPGGRDLGATAVHLLPDR